MSYYIPPAGVQPALPGIGTNLVQLIFRGLNLFGNATQPPPDNQNGMWPGYWNGTPPPSGGNTDEGGDDGRNDNGDSGNPDGDNTTSPVDPLGGLMTSIGPMIMMFLMIKMMGGIGDNDDDDDN